VNATARIGKTLIASAFSIILTIFLILPFCGWMFQCGCGFSWSSYGECNIHQSNVPHCPWCVDRLAVGLVTFFLVGIVTGYWFKVMDGYPYFFSK